MLVTIVKQVKLILQKTKKPFIIYTGLKNKLSIFHDGYKYGLAVEKENDDGDTAGYFYCNQRMAPPNGVNFKASIHAQTRTDSVHKL